ncbi:MAG: hypothetical protein JNM33_10045 [Rubrivivax sp.]|nr:hypothetical protein [Rubrivivax sp.]
MAIPHVAPGQVIALRPLGPGFHEAQTVALFKSENLEVIRFVLRAGKSLPPHRVLGDTSIHCIEGTIAVSAYSREAILHAGELIYLEGNAVHAVLAQEDSSALVTIALVKDQSGSLAELTERHSSGDA